MVTQLLSQGSGLSPGDGVAVGALVQPRAPWRGRGRPVQGAQERRAARWPPGQLTPVMPKPLFLLSWVLFALVCV